MRYFIIFLFSLMLFTGFSAEAKRRYRGLPRTEEGLMTNILGSLANKDSVSYYYLFVPFDTLWNMVLANKDPRPEVVNALNELKKHPQSLIEFDPAYNHNIIARFTNIVNKGEDSGIHWKGVVMQRYELQKQSVTRKLIGYDVIAPDRFMGFMFIRDLLGRHTFCITITEIQKINGYYFGGQVLNILEASSIDEYLHKEEQERRYFAWLAKNKMGDSAQADSMRIDSLAKLNDTSAAGRKRRSLSITIEEEDKGPVRKEVVDRRYYEGKFDDEIPVKLYVRIMKDPPLGKPVLYDGLYKFGDQKEYAKLTITKNPDGKWVMEDDPPIGTMELELKNKIFVGSWTNNENQTGYDVVLSPAPIEPAKLEQMDNILERGLAGRIDDEVYDEKDEKSKGKEADKDGKKEEQQGSRKSSKVEKLERKLKKEQEREKQKKLEEEIMERQRNREQGKDPDAPKKVRSRDDD